MRHGESIDELVAILAELREDPTAIAKVTITANGWELEVFRM